MMGITPTVLVLDGHTTQALAAVRSLGRAGYRVIVASHRRTPLGGWSKHCVRVRRVAGETLEAFDALRSWSVSHGISVVLPMTERSCVLCNVDRAAWEAAGVIVGCAPWETLLGAFDKAQTIRFAAAAGVRAPRTMLPSSDGECSEAGEALGVPCIVKPRFSSAWTGETFLADGRPRYVDDAASLADAVDACRQGVHWPLIQEIVPGQGKGVFTLFDRGEPVVWFAHERLRDVRPTGAGSSLRRSAELDPRLREPAERLLRAMKWHGPAMVEFRDDGVNEPWLMEVNGRFWGSLELAVTAGIDFPRLWVDLLRGITPAPAAPYPIGVTVRWLWGDIKRFITIVSRRPSGYTGPFPTIVEGLHEQLRAQPQGTRLEAWHPDDRWPAVGELVQGIGELAMHLVGRTRSRRSTGGARRAPPSRTRGISTRTSSPGASATSAAPRVEDSALVATHHSREH